VRRLAADRAASHCRLAYLRGRILSRGSLSLASGLIHLEIVVTEAEGRELAALAAAERLGGALRLRRGRGVVVWKDTSQICDLLRRLGAGGSIAEIEARGVARQIRGALNRTVNAETANLRRAVRAGMRQARAVAVVMEEHGLPAESLLQRVGVARLANPDATIAELGLALGLSRGAVQRALGSIEKLAATVRQEAALR
jgi:DNA-binding protein WhiA